jgi:hypothetical protein
MTTTWGKRHSRGLLTFYHSGLRRCSFCAWLHGFDLREGSGLLDSKCRIFFSRCRVGFISLPGQISRLPAQCKIGGQPSKTTMLQVLFGKVFTYKLDRTMVTVGAPSMLAMSTSPASVGASSVACAATGSSAPVVVLASGLLSSASTYCSTTLIVCCGGWTAAPFSRLAHRVPVLSFPFVNRVGRWNLLRQLRIQFVSAQHSKTSTRLLYLRNSPLGT